MELRVDDAKHTLQTIYQPYPVGRSDIRLCLLRKGPHTALVECDLLVVSLNEKPIYEALSYVWGDPSVTITIKLCGGTFPVTVNLEAALLTLRLEDHDRIIWADAICIQQFDKEERSHQVSQMGRTYSQAEGVLAWLGPGSKETDLAMDAIEELSKNPSLHWIPLEGHKSLENFHSKFRSDYLTTLGKLLASGWWARVWTLQELMLAKDYTLLCGEKAASSHQCEGLRASFTAHENNCCTPLTFFGELADGMTSLVFFERLRQTMKLARLKEETMASKDELKEVREKGQRQETAHLTEKGTVPVNEDDPGGNIAELSTTSPLVETLHNDQNSPVGKETEIGVETITDLTIQTMHMQRFRKCHDPRDKIYGYIGLSFAYNEPVLDICYDLPVFAVYAKFTFRSICKEKSVNIFTLVFPGHNESACPSWVPEWQNNLPDLVPATAMRYENLASFHASKTLFEVPVLLPDDVLSITGYFCDSIQHISALSLDATVDVWEGCWDWWPLLEKSMSSKTHTELLCQLLLGCPATFDSLSPDFAEIAQYLLAKTNLVDEQASEASEISSEQNHRATPTSLAIGSQVDFKEVESEVRTHTYMRRLVVSKTGYVGLAPEDVKIRDKICILSGGRVPFIIRRSE